MKTAKATIVTKYLPATDTKGARIKATITDGPSMTLPYSFDGSVVSQHSEAATTVADMYLLNSDGTNVRLIRLPVPAAAQNGNSHVFVVLPESI